MRLILLFSAFIFQFSVLAQSWVSSANIPSGRHHPVTFSLNGIGYSVTGSNTNNLPTKDFYKYDPVLDTWTSLTQFPGTARSYSIGTTLNGLAYMGFGATSTQYLNDLWHYNPQNEQWTQLTSCPCSARSHPAFIALNNKIYVGLGNNNVSDLKDWWEYNILTDSWTQMADLPGPARHHPFHFSAQGEVFAGMGHGGPIVYKDWYKLDTTSNAWTAQIQFPGEARVAGTQFNNADFGYVLSGDGDDHSYMSTGEFWRYDASIDYWLQLSAHPGVSRWAPGSFVIDDVVYFFGGVNRQTNQLPNDMWKFDLEAASVGIAENVNADLRVFPNPAKYYISWELNNVIKKVVILNAFGQVAQVTDGTSTKIDVSSWQAGMYFVQFYSQNEVLKIEKVLIQH